MTGASDGVELPLSMSQSQPCFLVHHCSSSDSTAADLPSDEEMPDLEEICPAMHPETIASPDRPETWAWPEQKALCDYLQNVGFFLWPVRPRDTWEGIWKNISAAAQHEALNGLRLPTDPYVRNTHYVRTSLQLKCILSQQGKSELYLNALTNQTESEMYNLHIRLRQVEGFEWWILMHARMENENLELAADIISAQGVRLMTEIFHSEFMRDLMVAMGLGHIAKARMIGAVDMWRYNYAHTL